MKNPSLILLIFFFAMVFSCVEDSTDPTSEFEKSSDEILKLIEEYEDPFEKLEFSSLQNALNELRNQGSNYRAKGITDSHNHPLFRVPEVLAYWCTEYKSCDRVQRWFNVRYEFLNRLCQVSTDCSGKFWLVNQLLHLEKQKDAIGLEDVVTLQELCDGLLTIKNTFIEFDPSDITLRVGEKFTFDNYKFIAGGEECTGFEIEAWWVTPENMVPPVIKIDQNGTVEGLSTGNVSVHAFIRKLENIEGVATVTVVDDNCADPFSEGCVTAYKNHISGYEDNPRSTYFTYEYDIEVSLSTINGVTEGAIWLIGGLTEFTGSQGNFNEFSFYGLPLSINGNTFTHEGQFNFFQHQGYISGTIHSNTIDLYLNFGLWTSAATLSEFHINTTLDRVATSTPFR